MRRDFHQARPSTLLQGAMMGTGVRQQVGPRLPLGNEMPQSVHPLIATRREQIFPVLEPEEIERLERFGERKSYVAGERMVATGEVAPGAFLILRGRVVVTQGGREGHSEPIVRHGPGSFMGELAQLSGRPSLVDAVATEAAEAFVIPPRRLRDL